MTLRIAMWSGPRNLSTALMRAFEQRNDTEVIDEPMYAHYLCQTGLEHPGRTQIVASQPQTWPELRRWVTGSPPHGAPVWFHKQMAHHLIPEVMGWDWLRHFRHAFLIRDPAYVVASYIRRRPTPTLADLGFATQHQLFVYATKIHGTPPPVIDADELLQNPRGMLAALCTELGLEFQASMLSWPPGRRSTDGVWAEYWYDAVEASTGFHPYKARTVDVPNHYRELVERAQALQQPLHEARLTPAT